MELWIRNTIYATLLVAMILAVLSLTLLPSIADKNRITEPNINYKESGYPTLSEVMLLDYNVNTTRSLNFTIKEFTMNYEIYDITGTDKQVLIFSEGEVDNYARQNNADIRIEEKIQKVYVLPEATDPEDLSMADKCLLVPFAYVPKWVSESTDPYLRITTDSGTKCLYKPMLDGLQPLQTFYGFFEGQEPETYGSSGLYVMKFQVDCVQIDQSVIANCR